MSLIGPLFFKDLKQTFSEYHDSNISVSPGRSCLRSEIQGHKSLGCFSPFVYLPSFVYHRFSNLGNTCYMNAILQSLFSLPSFSSDMLRQSIPWKKLPINALLRYCASL